MKKGKFVIAGLILFLAIGFLGYRGITASSAMLLDVSQLQKTATSLEPGQRVNVDGNVVPNSVKSSVDAKGQVLEFTVVDIKDNTSTLPVVYRGVVPDTFKPDSEVVVEGTLGASGVFQADVMSTKCASKYTP